MCGHLWASASIIPKIIIASRKSTHAVFVLGLKSAHQERYCGCFSNLRKSRPRLSHKNGCRFRPTRGKKDDILDKCRTNSKQEAVQSSLLYLRVTEYLHKEIIDLPAFFLRCCSKNRDPMFTSPHYHIPAACIYRLATSLDNAAPALLRRRPYHKGQLFRCINFCACQCPWVGTCNKWEWGSQACTKSSPACDGRKWQLSIEEKGKSAGGILFRDVWFVARAQRLASTEV